MKELTEWFQQVLDAAIRLYFKQECDLASLHEIEPPRSMWWQQMTGRPGEQLSFDEKLVIMLALMPHLYPQALDIFFVNNKNLDRKSVV